MNNPKIQRKQLSAHDGPQTTFTDIFWTGGSYQLFFLF